MITPNRFLVVLVLFISTLHTSLCVSGLKGYYFNNTAAHGDPIKEQIDLNIDFKWGNTERFSALWLGQFVAPTSGSYSFHFSQRGSARLWVDNQLLIDHWNQDDSDNDGFEQLPLIKNKPYLIRVEYLSHHLNVNNRLVLSYSVGGSPRAVVQPGQFIPKLTPPQQKQHEMRVKTERGWNTWYNKNTMAHVKLPEGIMYGWGLADLNSKLIVTDAHVKCDGMVHLGLHSANSGNFTEIKKFTWNGVQVRVQSATFGDDELVIIVTPLTTIPSNIKLIIYNDFLFNREGKQSDQDLSIQGMGGRQFNLLVNNQKTSREPPFTHPYMYQPHSFISFESSSSSSPIILSTTSISKEQAITLINDRRQSEQKHVDEHGGELYEPLYTVVNWNTIYHPLEGIFTPVSRGWDFGSGYVLFDWDNYFASMMSSLYSKDISYSNLFRITQSAVVEGFVPNYASGTHKTRDRTEPPIGSLAANYIYKRFGETWVLELVYDQLLKWNEWLFRARCGDVNGLCKWGTSVQTPVADGWSGKKYGSQLESGMDNSPMFDDIGYDVVNQTMHLYDVGMNALVLKDTMELIEMGNVLGRNTSDLKVRMDGLWKRMNDKLWDAEAGMYSNVRSDDGSFYRRPSPSNFYPLLIKGFVSDERVDAMMKTLSSSDHFCVSESCAYGLPSIGRSDPAFKDNDYWRGRIWAPLNMLVYLGLKNYEHVPSANLAKKALCRQSKTLLLQNWSKFGHVQENYNGETGDGCDVGNADPFYHWGALNALLNLMEQ